MLDCVVMKNWLPFVLGPQFAMDTLPGAECLRGKWRGAGVCAGGGGGTCAQASEQAHRQQTLATAGITIGRQAPSAGRHRRQAGTISGARRATSATSEIA